jgi:hypothetical protein
MSRSIRVAGILRLAGLAAAAALAASGCGKGTSQPSGFTSPAANFNGAATTGGATTGGTTTGGTTTGGTTTGGSTGSFRAIAWDGSQILPGNSPGFWIFFETGSLNVNTLDLVVNGTAMGTGPVSKLVSPIANGTGSVIILAPPPAPGATIQVKANNSQGSPQLSNTIISKTTPIPSGNTPTGGFQAQSPAAGATAVGTGPSFTFTAAAQASSYNLVCFEIGPSPTNPQQSVITDIPVSVEVAAPGSFTVGNPPAHSYANVFLNQPGVFVWHVVALDQDGWGVGTTIDVPGFNAAGQNAPPAPVAATWPDFQS